MNKQQTKKGNKMTIRELVQQQPIMDINQWLAFIQDKKLQEHERTIIECADYYGKISINHNATFNSNNILNF